MYDLRRQSYDFYPMSYDSSPMNFIKSYDIYQAEDLSHQSKFMNSKKTYLAIVAIAECVHISTLGHANCVRVSRPARNVYHSHVCVHNTLFKPIK